MKKFGLIGDPIAHSLSPALFRAGYDGRYTYDLIEGTDFEVSFKRFLDDYDGINITAPFKEKAFSKADILSKECLSIGAANILVKTPEGIKAYNSDYLGVQKWLTEISHEQNKKVLIVGCGGAGKAAAHASLSLGFHTTLINRDISKAKAIAQQYLNKENNKSADKTLVKVSDITDFRKELYTNDILIYNIPVPIPELSKLESLDFIGRETKLNILEANYRDPSFCGKLSEMIDNSNGKVEYTDGKTWLLNQALTGYEIFTGEIPDLDKMSACL